jgi:hypothetical protein
LMSTRGSRLLLPNPNMAASAMAFGHCIGLWHRARCEMQEPVLRIEARQLPSPASMKKNVGVVRAAGQARIIPHRLPPGKAGQGPWHISCIDAWCSTVRSAL